MSFSPLSPFSSVYCQWVQCERVKAWVKRLYQLQGGTVYIINARIHDVWTPHGKGWGQSIKAASAFQLVRLFRGFYFLYKSILTAGYAEGWHGEKQREREIQRKVHDDKEWRDEGRRTKTARVRWGDALCFLKKCCTYTLPQSWLLSLFYWLISQKENVSLECA